MSSKHEEPRRQRCTASAKASGERCARWAREGYDVCPVHGAGTKVRVAAGTRQDPAAAGTEAGTRANLKHGRYMARTKARFTEAMGDFLESEDDLFNLKIVAARLWGALLTLDEVEAAFDLSQLVEMPDAVKLCECGSLFRRADLAKDLLQRVFGIRTVLSDLVEVVRTKNKLDDKAAGSITETQMVAIVVMLVTKLHDLVQDQAITREDIPRRLTAWIESSAKGATSASPG